MSSPIQRPAKWNGMNTVPGATRGVTSAATFTAEPSGVRTLEAGARRIGGVHLGEHLLLELGQPLVDARLVAPALELDEPPRRQDERVLLRIVVLLDRPEEGRQPPMAAVVVRAVLGEQVAPRRVERLAVERHRIGVVPHEAARL